MTLLLTMPARAALASITLALACARPGTQLAILEPPNATAPARYLYVWAGDKDERDSDFLAVVDVNPASARYGAVIATTPVNMIGTLPHHLEYSLPGDGELLYANGHHHEAIFLFDLSRPEEPRLAGRAQSAPPLRYPHDFARLPNGNVLVGFLRSNGPSPIPADTMVPGGHGGIAEFTRDGRLVRSASAAAGASVDQGRPVRPYAFALPPGTDRVLVTSAAMMENYNADVVQIFRLSDFTLLTTLRVPPALLPNGRVLTAGHELPFGPRLMPDGSVLLNAYGCGFYHVTGIATSPRIENVFTLQVPDSFPNGRLAACGVPLVIGKYWIMPVGRMHMVVVLDVSNPARPVEVSRLRADSGFRPHWSASDPGSNRIIVGAENGGESRMLMARLDTKTGQLTWDTSFRSADGELGISFVRSNWPHGATGEAFGHAALFRR